MNNKKPQYYVSLAGGLGNQLFQLAYARSVQSTQSLVLVNDYQSNNYKDPCSQPLLDFDFRDIEASRKFDSPSNIALSAHNYLLRLSTSFENFTLRHYNILARVQNTLSRIFGIIFFKRMEIVTQPCIGSYKRLKLKEDRNYLQIGYFQHCQWTNFEKTRTKMQDLELKHKSSVFLAKEKELGNIRFLSVHMRFGDYLQERKFGIPSKGYYEKSLKSQVSSGTFEKIVVFTNDAKLAREYLPKDVGLPIEVIGENFNFSASETLSLMRIGSGFILANSTFGWWGAFLSRSESPTVIFPSPWFAEMKDPVGLFPQEWISVESK